MDVLIESYINTHYIAELQNEIARAFTVLNGFNYVDQELPFINLIMTEDLDAAPNLLETFLETLKSQQEEVFKAHLIEVSDQASLLERNELLVFLLNVMDLQDYNPLETIFSQAVDPEHAFAQACELCSELKEHRALELILKVDLITFNLMKKFVHKKLLMRSSTVPVFTEVGQKIIHHLRQFSAFVQTDELIGIHLLNAGFNLNAPYTTMIRLMNAPTLFENVKDEEIAKQILSFLFLNEEGIDHPLDAFQKNVSLFLTDLSQISKVQSFVNKYVLDFATYLKAEHEKARLLQARHTSA